jgi:hypothetical protein
MSNNLIGGLIVFALIALLIVGIVGMIRSPKKGAGIASLTAFHDLQAKDKQNAIEIIIEQQSGKKMVEQESGEEIKNKGTKEQERHKEAGP